MQNRYVLFLLILSISTFIGGTVYVASVGLQERILFPTYANIKGGSQLCSLNGRTPFINF